MPLDYSTSTSAPSPPLTAVATQMDRAAIDHGHAINDLGGTVGQLEERLAFFLHPAPPANANEKSAPAKPRSSNPIIGLLDASTEEIEQCTETLRCILERLPT
jgi:hypothetical protein